MRMKEFTPKGGENQFMSEPFLTQKSYKNEVIMEQYFDTKELFILTKADGKWNLYNHSKNKKIGSSKDWEVLHDKMYDPN